ncbi:MAG: hypothetical protein IIU97_01570, partial [Bacteroidaceae bacterium]|nr:hypothetical protein [Bacteroidaceae bacterium]
SECKGNSFTLPSARQLDVVTAGYVTAKKGKTGNKAAGKRAQIKFTCFAEQERVRENKGHKKTSTSYVQSKYIFERKLNNF